MALLIIFIIGFIWRPLYLAYLLGKDGKSCEHRSRVLAQINAQERVDLAEDFCAGPAFSAVGILSFVSGDGAAQRFFEYQENGTDPVIRWDRNHRFFVTADVDEVYFQKNSVRDYSITYDIKRSAP
jgi:hypothetical protein